jgi:hypothetical protein
MKGFRWLAGGGLGAVVTLLVGFRVETTGGGWRGRSLPDWLFGTLLEQDPVHMAYPPPTYSALYWAVAGFIIGALWVIARQRD